MNANANPEFRKVLQIITGLPAIMDVGLTEMAANPEQVEALRMITVVIQVVAMVIFFLWALLLVQTYRWSTSDSLGGDIVYSWFVYLNGFVALLGLIFVMVLYTAWGLLDLQRYEEGGYLEKAITWFGENAEGKESTILSSFTSMLGGMGTKNTLVWVNNYTKALMYRRRLLRTVRYVMYATAGFSLASLGLFMFATPSLSARMLSLVGLVAVGGGVTAAMMSSPDILNADPTDSRRRNMY